MAKKIVPKTIEAALEKATDKPDQLPGSASRPRVSHPSVPQCLRAFPTPLARTAQAATLLTSN